MADNKNDDHEHPGHEEEFGEDFDFEESHHEDPLAPQAHEGSEIPGEDVQEVAPPTKHKNVMLPLVVGVIVLGFIGWKAYGILTKPKTTTEGGPKEQQVQVAKALPKEAPVSAPAVGEGGQPKTAVPNLYEAEQQAKQAVANEQITATVQKKIDEQMTAQKQHIDNMQKEVAAATQNTTNATKAIGTMQQDLTGLKAAVAELSAQIKALKDAQAAEIAKIEAERAAAKVKKVKPKPKITKHSGAFTNPAVTVHAIIPGRAWLRTSDGKTITVTEGDSVGEYGKVLKIDAPNGLVVTTSGVSLR